MSVCGSQVDDKVVTCQVIVFALGTQQPRIAQCGSPCSHASPILVVVGYNSCGGQVDYNYCMQCTSIFTCVASDTNTSVNIKVHTYTVMYNNYCNTA